MSRRKDIRANDLQPLKPIPTGTAAVLSKMTTYGALLFDVYGTLLVSGAGEVGLRAGNPTGQDRILELLQRYGIELSPQELRQALVRAIEAEHRKLKKRGVPFPEVDIRRVWKDVLQLRQRATVQRFALEYEWITNPVFPMPGATTVIRACMEKKVPLGIISNAQFYTDWTLADLFGDDLYAKGFDSGLRFFSWQAQHAKPGETMFRRARETLETMGIAAESVLYVGNDMLNDIRPAGAVGFQTALFAGDRRSLRTRKDDERCRGVRPDLVVTDLRQLLAGIGTPGAGE